MCEFISWSFPSCSIDLCVCCCTIYYCYDHCSLYHWLNSGSPPLQLQFSFQDCWLFGSHVSYKFWSFCSPISVKMPLIIWWGVQNLGRLLWVVQSFLTTFILPTRTWHFFLLFVSSPISLISFQSFFRIRCFCLSAYS